MKIFFTSVYLVIAFGVIGLLSYITPKGALLIFFMIGAVVLALLMIGALYLLVWSVGIVIDAIWEKLS